MARFDMARFDLARFDLARFGRLAVTAAAVLAAVAVVPAAASAAPPGSYAGPVSLRGDLKTVQWVLNGVDVEAQRVVVRLLLRNAGGTVATFSCPDKATAAAAEVVTDAAGRARNATESYCQARPSTKFQLKAGADLAVTGVFPADGWTDGQFTLAWYGGTTGLLTLGGGKVLPVAAPSSGDDDSSWAMWVLIGLAVVALVVVGLWLRLLLRRGRFLFSLGAVAVAWFLGVHNWVALLAIATVVALVVVGVSKLFSSGGGGGYQPGYDPGYNPGYDPGYAGGSPAPYGPSDGGDGGGWGWSPGPAAEERPLDRGFYGDGPQHGTSRPADEPGSIWGDGPGQGTRTPYSEPGGFYSDRPFGS